MIASLDKLSLRATVDRLERALIAPLSSDSLIMWVLTVKDSTEALEEVLPYFLEDVFHSDFAGIARFDNKLLPDVEQLIEAERRLLVLKENFCRGLNNLASRLPHKRDDEVQVADERLQVKRQGMELVVELKYLQSAANSWQQAAIYRERNPVG